MFLTAVRCMNKSCLPYRFRGKYRLIQKITGKDLYTVGQDLKREEENMFYLRHPFVSSSEYKGVGKTYRKIQDKILDRAMEEKRKKFVKTENSRKLDVYYKYLASHETWEC